VREILYVKWPSCGFSHYRLARSTIIVQVGDQFFRQIGSLSGLFDKSAENAAGAASALAAEATRAVASSGGTHARERPTFVGCIKGRECSFRLGGRSARVDFQMQPGIIDNEYLSAVTAHSSYFSNEDIIDFLIFNTQLNDKKEC